MTDLSLAPLSGPAAPTATDQVFDTLYAAVISLQLPPGTKVSETEIARQLDVSRQPVRDAFFRLSKLGFLAIRPQRATLITKISEKAVLDAVFVRVALETECLRLVALQRSEADLERLRRHLAQQEAALDLPDATIFHRLDEEFHLTLCDIAGHRHVWDLIREQKAHMDRVRFLTLNESRRRTVLGEHGEIVGAIAHQDPARTEKLLRHHLGDIRYAMSRIRTEHAWYFE